MSDLPKPVFLNFTFDPYRQGITISLYGFSDPEEAMAVYRDLPRLLDQHGLMPVHDLSERNVT